VARHVLEQPEAVKDPEDVGVQLDAGAGFLQLVAALNRLLELTVPERTQEGGTYVVPGHGRICDEADVVEYRDMVVIIRDRIQDMVARGLTLARVQAERPSRDYDTQYVAPGSVVPPEAFVEAIYRSLTDPPAEER
jgi:glyoxylase-like metal-dependent hydrolase (beta-lactamase superfamily II)